MIMELNKEARALTGLEEPLKKKYFYNHPTLSLLPIASSQERKLS
jgi:hypothetical protein